MPKRTWMILTSALLLAGFTATVADAGETRRAGGKVVVSDEDDAGRKARRSARPTVPQTKPRATRSTPTRRPAAAPEKTRRSQHVVPGNLKRRPPSRVVERHPARRPDSRAPVRRWIPGRYEDRVHQVWVPGFYRTKHVPARYESRRGWLGITWRYRIAPARTKKVWVPGHYREEVQRVWIPGHWTRLPPTRHGYRPHR